MVIDDTVLLFTGRSGTTCLDAATGDLIWRNEVLLGYDGSLVVQDSLFYVPTTSETLEAVRLDSGQELWAIKSGSYSRQVMISGSRVVLSFLNGIKAIETDGIDAVH